MAAAHSPSDRRSSVVRAPAREGRGRRPSAPLDEEQERPEEDLRGVVLDGRYRLIRPLGAGGMGTVYLAEHVFLGTALAVKVLSRRFAFDAEWVQRFVLEARASLMIGHEHVVRVHDLACPPGGRMYMVMDFVDGESLAELIEREGPLPWRRALRIADQIAAALAAAHARGIVHRDVKPSNCIRTEVAGEPEFIKVLDFGIAKFLDPARDGLSAPCTSSGLWMGTAEFMAPELFRGDPVDARVDIYALGALIFKLLTGRTPFQGTHLEVATRQLAGDPPTPGEVAAELEIPAAVDELVARALAMDPSARTPTMEALRAEIAALLAAAEGFEATLLAPARPQAEVVAPPAARRPVRRTSRRLVGLAALVGLVAPCVALWATIRGAHAELVPQAPVSVPVSAPVSVISPPRVGVPAPPVLVATPVPSQVVPAPQEVPGRPVEVVGAEARPRRSPEARPESLTAEALWAELRRIGPVIANKCFRAQGMSVGTGVVGKVAVDDAGRASVRFGEGTADALARCIAGRVESHRFPRTRRGGGLVHRFALEG